MDSRRLLLELFEAALRAVDGAACVERALRRRPPAGPVRVFAVGKAAAAMCRGAYAALGDQVVESLVITRHGHADAALARRPGVTLLEAAHPIPDETSLAAGEELLRRLAQVQGEDLFLVSGGASSLVEVLRPGVTLQQLRALNEQGLAAGWDIGALNRRRAELSRLKRGGVARALAGRPARALFVSDVPGDDVDVIGSGLLGRDADAADGIEREVVASIDTAMAAVVEAAAARGLHLRRAAGRFAADVAEVGREFLAIARATDADGLVWGGESLVTLPESVGRGGRNTHLALQLAQSMKERDRLTILAAGTDGTDGATDDAGAIVDAGTVSRAELGGVDVPRALAAFDSALALEAAGDLVHTGPTGTNVGDLLIAIRQQFRDPGSARML